VVLSPVRLSLTLFFPKQTWRRDGDGDGEAHGGAQSPFSRNTYAPLSSPFDRTCQKRKRRGGRDSSPPFPPSSPYPPPFSLLCERDYDVRDQALRVSFFLRGPYPSSFFLSPEDPGQGLRRRDHAGFPRTRFFTSFSPSLSEAAGKNGKRKGRWRDSSPPSFLFFNSPPFSPTCKDEVRLDFFSGFPPLFFSLPFLPSQTGSPPLFPPHACLLSFLPPLPAKGYIK